MTKCFPPNQTHINDGLRLGVKSLHTLLSGLGIVVVAARALAAFHDARLHGLGTDIEEQRIVAIALKLQGD